jgi:hypothetical protein
MLASAIPRRIPVFVSRSVIVRRALPLALLLLGAARTPLAARVVDFASGPPQGGQQRIAPGKLVIRNIAWDSVRVEVRVGGAQDCELNPSLGVHQLRRGRSWAIASVHAICWRRERSPGGRLTGMWTGWTRMMVTPGAVEWDAP